MCYTSHPHMLIVKACSCQVSISDIASKVWGDHMSLFLCFRCIGQSWEGDVLCLAPSPVVLCLP